ncbi:MAG: hypothetical protein FWC69_02270 [Defluviitaleaceae bacterium]|nr:hypothetical protein [Defluviitaleaceae bacterium]
MMDFIAGLGVMVVLGVAITITSLNAKHLKSETSRKIIHITMGLTALTFPFIFENAISVVLLGAAALLALLLLRRVPILRNSIGKALLGVGRKTYGELWFAFSIAVIFVFHESLYEYFIPILVLTFADSVAALIGASYGRKNLADAEEDAKSREGSVLFFIVAFICALVPLQLMTEIGRAEVLLISFLVGLLGAMIEAVSIDGNDNVLLPLLTYSFIRYNSYAPLSLLLTNFAMMMLFWVALFMVRKTRNLSRLSMAYGPFGRLCFMDTRRGYVGVFPRCFAFDLWHPAENG